MFSLKYNKNNPVLTKAKMNVDPKMKDIHLSLPDYNAMIYICGAPASGKTNLLYNLFFKRTKNTYYHKFHIIHIFSPTDTMKYNIPPENRHRSMSFNELDQILTDDNNKNLHNLILFDDMINLINQNITFKRLCDNRRHVFFKDETEEDTEEEPDEQDIFECNILEIQPEPEQGQQEEKQKPICCGSCTVVITSQKYNKLQLGYRNACSNVILFKPDPLHLSKTIYIFLLLTCHDYNFLFCMCIH